MRLMWPGILQYGPLILIYSFQFQYFVKSQQFGLHF